MLTLHDTLGQQRALHRSIRGRKGLAKSSSPRDWPSEKIRDRGLRTCPIGVAPRLTAGDAPR